MVAEKKKPEQLSSRKSQVEHTIVPMPNCGEQAATHYSIHATRRAAFGGRGGRLA